MADDLGSVLRRASLAKTKRIIEREHERSAKSKALDDSRYKPHAIWKRATKGDPSARSYVSEHKDKF